MLKIIIGHQALFQPMLKVKKNFTITREHLDQALKNFPEIKDKVEIFVDWDEDNFKTSISNSDILLAWNFPTTNLKKIAPNLKWIHCISAGVEHLLPLDWIFDNLVLTNSSGVHAKKIWRIWFNEYFNASKSYD